MNLPVEMVAMLGAFAPLFSDRVWLRFNRRCDPRPRTVTQALRVMGLSEERHWTSYHRILSRAVWSPLPASKILLGLIVRRLGRRQPDHHWGR